jgi:hypothetical protein
MKSVSLGCTIGNSQAVLLLAACRVLEFDWLLEICQRVKKRAPAFRR